MILLTSFLFFLFPLPSTLAVLTLEAGMVESLGFLESLLPCQYFFILSFLDLLEGSKS